MHTQLLVPIDHTCDMRRRKNDDICNLILAPRTRYNNLHEETTFFLSLSSSRLLLFSFFLLCFLRPIYGNFDQSSSRHSWHHAYSEKWEDARQEIISLVRILLTLTCKWYHSVLRSCCFSSCTQLMSARKRRLEHLTRRDRSLSLSLLTTGNSWA